MHLDFAHSRLRTFFYVGNNTQYGGKSIVWREEIEFEIGIPLYAH